MELKIITAGTEYFLCDYYRFENFNDPSKMLELYIDLSNKNPDYKYLYTLDDIDQAGYTSGHSKMSYNLDDTDEHDLSPLSETCFEDGEHKGYLSRNEEFYIREANFNKGLSRVQIEDIKEKYLYIAEDDQEAFFKANENPGSIVDDVCFLLKVPVENSYQSIMAFPNGYFSVDLSPFENYLLAQKLELEFDYKLFGIGASFIVFYKSKQLSKGKVAELTDYLCEIYCDKPNPEMYNMFTKTINEKDILVLVYTECIE